MNELKEVVDLIAKLPQMALWFAIAFWVYKVTIIGSIYGVIRLVILKTHDIFMRQKTQDIALFLDGKTMGDKEQLIGAFRAARSRREKSGNDDFLYSTDAAFIIAAISEKITREKDSK